jgi:hypothetical protein
MIEFIYSLPARADTRRCATKLRRGSRTAFYSSEPLRPALVAGGTVTPLITIDLKQLHAKIVPQLSRTARRVP